MKKLNILRIMVIFSILLVGSPGWGQSVSAFKVTGTSGLTPPLAGGFHDYEYAEKDAQDNAQKICSKHMTAIRVSDFVYTNITNQSPLLLGVLATANFVCE